MQVRQLDNKSVTTDASSNHANGNTDHLAWDAMRRGQHIAVLHGDAESCRQ